VDSNPGQEIRADLVMGHGANSHVIVDDAYHFLRDRGLHGYHCTVEFPPQLDEVQHVHHQTGLLDLQHQDQNQLPLVSGNNKCSLLYVFSAADEGGLARLSKCYYEYIHDLVQRHGKKDLSQLLDRLAYTLCQHRSKLPWRSFILANDVVELGEMKMERAIRAKKSPCLGFVFTGQGAQYSGMARRLLTQPIFKASLDSSQRFLDDLGCHWSVSGMSYYSNTLKLFS
jgi:acyl transferase domain-containing protein